MARDFSGHILIATDTRDTNSPAYQRRLSWPHASEKNRSSGNLPLEIITHVMIYGAMKKPLDRDPLVLIHDVARLMRTRADARARAFGMTRAQWMILVRLENQPGMSQNELAALIEVEPITVARLVDRLEGRGFVERRADPTDRRIWRLHLTPTAGPMLKEIARVRRELNETLVAEIPAKELESVIDCLLQMKCNLTAEQRKVEAG